MQGPDIDKAMEQVPRAGFLRPAERADAAVDAPLPIGLGQSSSQPRTVHAMLRLLSVEPGQRVLDVGAGSGWTTALLATLVGPKGLVVGVELEPELAKWGAENLARADLPWASIRAAARDVLGWPQLGPYDRILVSANAREMPAELIDQLADVGVMVVPVDSTMTRVRRPRGTSGALEVTTHGSFSFVPLR